MKYEFNYGDQGICPHCGSRDVTMVGIEFGVDILITYECNNCECEFIDVYENTIKGITTKE